MTPEDWFTILLMKTAQHHAAPPSLARSGRSFCPQAPRRPAVITSRAPRCQIARETPERGAHRESEGSRDCYQGVCFRAVRLALADGQKWRVARGIWDCHGRVAGSVRAIFIELSTIRRDVVKRAEPRPSLTRQALGTWIKVVMDGARASAPTSDAESLTSILSARLPIPWRMP